MGALAAVIAEGGELEVAHLPLIELARQLEQESARLLVLATKHCPPWHHDWDAIRDLDAKASALAPRCSPLISHAYS
jgi:hypothetical protein